MYQGKSYYETLMTTWAALAHRYPGWSLTEIKNLSPRERLNWLSLSTR